MSAKWSGFSEEEQARIKSQEFGSTQVDPMAVNGDASGQQQLTRVAGGMNGKTSTTNKKGQKLKITSNANADPLGNGGVPYEALLSSKALSRQDKGAESPVHVKLRIVEDNCFEIMETVSIDSPREEPSLPPSKSETVSHLTSDHSSAPLSVDLLQSSEKKEPMNLDEFKQRQKVIEEQNRLKKEMLAKALALRKKKTQAEAQKLHQIQDELSKLDASLTNDVSILRSQIEIASVELAEAEKRYLKAEREFVEAKQLLFGKRERKDLLTEHLCTIIEQNEFRKAHRLTDLMVQLSDQDQETETALSQIVEPISTPND